MFNKILDQWKDFDYPLFFSKVTNKDVEHVLTKEHMSSMDLLTLLSPEADNFLEEMAMLAQQKTIKQFGRTIQLYTPLYLSNYCRNGCVYCGFNMEQKISRTRLTLEEIEKEADYIKSTGIQHILVLTGGDREKTDIDYILQSVEILKKYFSSISIEMYSMTENEYKQLVDRGVNNVTIYQETYNKKLYKKLHKYGEKADYNFRLNAPERAAAAGVNSVNLGVLLGLDNPEKDFFKTSLHGEYISRKYPGTSIAISFPRIRPAAGGFKPDYIVSDFQLIKFISAFRLFMPRGEISISTRETAELRDNILPIGPTKMSAGSITSVGSRSKKSVTENQFDISDSRSVLQMDKSLREKDFQPVYKDWNIL